MLFKTVDILAINDTRLDSSIQDGEVSIPGYTLERKDRNRNGGGVALYIRDSINYKGLPELPDDNMELISIFKCPNRKQNHLLRALGRGLLGPPLK